LSGSLLSFVLYAEFVRELLETRPDSFSISIASRAGYNPLRDAPVGDKRGNDRGRTDKC